MTRTVDGDAVRAETRATYRAISLGVLVLAVATVVFLYVPVGALSGRRTAIVTVAFVGGVAGAAALVVWQVLSYRRAALSGRARLQGLLVTLYLAVLFFALTYYVLAGAHSEQIEGLRTRVDGLYFSLAIVSTVGFGDVHAIGQAARAVVSLQIGFNLLFVSLAVAAARAATPSGPTPGRSLDRTRAADRTRGPDRTRGAGG